MKDWRVIWALVRKDATIWLRQPTSIAATLLPALALIVVIYFAAAAVGVNPVALVVLDSGPHARQLTDVLESSDAFRVIRATPSEANRMLTNVDVAAVITIPASFDSAYDAHQPDPVTIRMNNLNLDFSNDLRRSLPAAIAQFYAEQPNNPIDVRISETDLRRRDVSLMQFDLVPDLVLLLTIAGVVNAGLATAREWDSATIKELLLAPTSRTSLIVGKLLAGWLTTLVVGGVILVIGAIGGYLQPSGWYWLPTLIVVALLALASSGLGVALGAALRRTQPVAAIGIPVSFYLFFLSGGISVVAFLPGWVQTIARFIPTYYGVHALQMAIFYSSTDLLDRDLLVLGATSAVTLTLGVIALRKSTLG